MNYLEIEPFASIANYIKNNNKGDVNPYHNNEHMMFVFNNAMTLFDHYKKEYDLSEQDRINLGVACLFHDFNHSGGKLKDSENIEYAIEAFVFYLEEHPSNISIEHVINLISVTEFPHKDIDLSILGKIIRDADMMGAISDNFIEIIKSLAEEIGYDIEKFLPIQLKFLQDVKYNTKYCRDLLEERREDILKEISNPVNFIKLKRATHDMVITLKNVTQAQAIALRKMFEYMEFLGHIGSSRTCSFYADGDGDFRPKFSYSYPEQLPEVRSISGVNMETGDYKVDYDSIAWKIYH